MIGRMPRETAWKMMCASRVERMRTFVQVGRCIVGDGGEDGGDSDDDDKDDDEEEAERRRGEGRQTPKGNNIKEK